MRRRILGTLVIALSFAVLARPTAPPAALAVTEPAGLQNLGPTSRGLTVESEYDALRVPDAADLDFETPLTIEGWVKRLRGAGCGTILGKGRGSGYWLGLCDGRLRFGAGTAEADGTAQLPEGRWNHVAAVFDGTTAILYVNGAVDRIIPLTGARLVANDHDLVLGADANPGAFLHGRLDHVRLWRLVRSELSLRSQALATLPPQAGLVGQWPLDGDGRDLAGGHDGRAGSGQFGPDGVLPQDLAVPPVASSLAVDGRCDPTEYGLAERLVLDGPDATLAYVQATANHLYVCWPDMVRPAGGNQVAALYLNRNLSGETRPQPGDYRFLLKPIANAVVEEGDGNAWKAVTLPAGTWDAARVATNEGWSAELRVARSLLEPPRDPDDRQVTGLALGYLAVRSANDDYFWPPAANGQAPNTWGTASFIPDPADTARYSFAGTVLYGQEDEARGAAGATVQLFWSDKDHFTLVDADVTDGGGQWELSWHGAPPDRFVVREIDPRGARSWWAQAPAAGLAVGENSLVFDIDADTTPVDSHFAPAVFWDLAGRVPGDVLLRHYAILYGAPVTEEDLWPIVASKRGQGFVITTQSVEAIDRAQPGRDRAERIHNYLVDLWATYGENAGGTGASDGPIYALLVGRGDVIPFRDIGWLDTDHRVAGRPDYHPAWPTDWYYADLDSDWDADGDGFYGEFLGCAPGTSYPDPEAEEDRDCPEAGSLAREGPYGDGRGPEDDYVAEIAVGRLPLNEPSEVRSALAALARFEEAGGAERRRALLAGSFWHYQGQSWLEERRTSVPGGNSRADPWLRAPWSGTRPFGHDAAPNLESFLPLTAGLFTETRRLYESTSPDNDPSLSPTLASPDAALTAAAFATEWGRGTGLALLSGRGGPTGIAGARWALDWDGDRGIDQAANPALCRGAGNGPPCNELVVEPFAHAGLPAPATGAPVVVANAGGSSAVAWDWDGVDAAGNVLGLRYGPAAFPGPLLASGRVAAWSGSLTPFEPGDLDGFQTALATGLVDGGLRLGDAHQLAAAELARGADYDPRAVGTVLFGDPARSYWGGVLDGGAPWPGDGGNRAAAGGTVYNGPAVPVQAWALRDPAIGTAPVIGRHGELILAGTGRIARVAGAGAIVAQITLPGTVTGVRYPAALTVDRVWLAAGDTLQVLDADLRGRTEVRLPSGASASGGPRPTGDGRVYVPTQQGLVQVDGAGRTAMVSTEGTRGTPALRRTGEVVWSTESGTVLGYRVHQDGQAVKRNLVTRNLGTLTAPAVSPVDTVYVGSGDGRVYALPDAGVAPWQLEAGGAVRLRPTVAADGTVYVVNAQAQLLAFAAEQRELLWRVNLGAAASASPAVDAGAVYVVTGRVLWALSRATGQVLWSIDLGGTTDERATPVIGPDRTLYVTRADQSLVAVREVGWLAAPSSVALEPVTGGFTVRWRDNSADERGFRVELCTLDERCAFAGNTAADNVGLDVRRLPFEATLPYYARVQAVGLANGAGAQLAATAWLDSEPALSDPQAALPDRPAPASAVGVEITGSNGATVTWRYEGALDALLGFSVSREDADGPTPVAVVGADARQLHDHDLRPERAYTYVVTAFGRGGVAAAARASASTWRQGLRAPTELAVTPDELGLGLQWRDTNIGETGILIERLDPAMAEFRPLARLSAGATTFLDHFQLVAGTYTYRIRALGEVVDSAPAFVTGRHGGPATQAVFLPLSYQRRR